MSKPTHKPPAAPGDKVPPRRSGRVQFDERGQAIWAWAVETGLFDRNASTQRVRALSETTMKLELAEAPAKSPKTTAAAPRKGEALTPYDRAPASPAQAQHKGTNPYSHGPAKSPESTTFNPYDRGPTRRR